MRIIYIAANVGGGGGARALTMREVVIVALAGALIGIMVVALLIHFLP